MSSYVGGRYNARSSTTIDWLFDPHHRRSSRSRQKNENRSRISAAAPKVAPPRRKNSYERRSMRACRTYGKIKVILLVPCDATVTACCGPSMSAGLHSFVSAAENALEDMERALRGDSDRLIPPTGVKQRCL